MSTDDDHDAADRAADHCRDEHRPTGRRPIPGPSGVGGPGPVLFDPVVHAAAVAEEQPVLGVMAPGWWQAPPTPAAARALELRHIRGLAMRDAVRVQALFAEVVDAGGPLAAGAAAAWEVLRHCALGDSATAAAAAEAATILSTRCAEAALEAGTFEVGMLPVVEPVWLADQRDARVRDLVREVAAGQRGRGRAGAPHGRAARGASGAC